MAASTVRIGFVRSLLIAALALAAAPASGADPVAGVAKYETPAREAIATVNAIVSLPVRATPVAVGAPVRKNEVLVEIDLRELEKELAGQRKALLDIQAEKRFRATNRENVQGNVAIELITKEANASRDLLETQTRISTASPRAPEDGFLVHRFYEVGAQTKKRKPLLTFLEAKRALLAIAVPADTAAAFPVGSKISVADAGDPARRFLATLEKSSPAGDGVTLTLRPLELPFLALDQTAQVLLSPAP